MIIARHYTRILSIFIFIVYILSTYFFINYIIPYLLKQTEADNLAKIMMSKKTKRLYDRMQHGIDKKKEAISNLEKKRDLQSSSIEKPVKKAKK